MTWEDAQDFLKMDVAVYREEWPTDKYVDPTGQNPLQYGVFTEAQPDNGTALLTDEDRAATDWVAVL